MICFVFGASYKNAVYHFVCICDFIPSFVNVNNKNSLYSFFYPNLSLIFGLCILPNFFLISISTPYKFV